MKTKILVAIVTMLLFTTSAWPQATNYNINGRPTSDWFSGQDSTRNIPLQWMRAIDPMVAAAGGSSTGNNFYVDSGLTVAGDGSSWANAVATWDAAVALCADNNGDTIHIAPGHAETFSTDAALDNDSVDLDVIGVTSIGYGTGTDRPTFTYADVDNEVVIAALNNKITNMVFQSGVADIVHAIEIEADADGSVIMNCEFLSGSTDAYEFVDAIEVAAAADDLIICYNKATETTAGAASWLDLAAGVVDNLSVYGNVIYGDYSTAVINSTSRAQTLLYLGYNISTNLNAADYFFYMNAAGTGVIEHNRMFGTTITTTLDPGSCICFENYISNTTDLSAVLVPPVPAIATVTAGSAEDILKKLYYTSDGTDAFAATVANDSTLAKIMASGATATASTFDNQTDSLQAIRDAVDGLAGIGFRGICVANTGDGETVESTELAGFGDDYFNTGWSMLCVYDASGAGSAPEGEEIDIIDYVSATGIFTMNVPFSAEMAAGDYIYVRRREDLNLKDATILGSAGTIRYVDSGASGDATGLTMENASVTIAAAEALCSAGDVVYVADGHNEAIGSLVLNVANVSYIGLGEGDGRPILDFDAAGDEITINAAGIVFKNFRLLPSDNAVVAGIVLGADGDGCLIENVSFIDGEGANDDFADCIVYDTATVGTTVKNCTYRNTNATAADQDTFVNLDAPTIASPSVIGCTVFGTFAEAPIWGGAAVPTNIYIADNTISNTIIGQLAIEFAGNATGVIKNNALYSDSYVTILDPGIAICINNWGTDAANQQAIQLPVSAETSDITATADGSNLERLEYLQNKSDAILAALGRDSAAANVFYVDSACAASAAGTEWATAEVTLKAAIDDATNGTDAVIFVAANHTEEFTASVAVDAPGVTIIGLGQGAARPIFTFNDEAAALTHTVADVRYVNCVFQCTTADSTVGHSLNASSDGAKFTDCEWLSTTEFEFLSAVTLASGCDDVEFHGCKFNNLTAGVGDATAAITNIAGVTDGMVIEGCEFYGLWSAAAITSDDADTDVLVKDNIVRNTEPGFPAISFSAAALGSCVNNMVYTDSYGIGLDPGSMGCFGNLHSYGADTAAIDTPLIAGKTYTLMANQASITATTDPLFGIAGGPIKIIDFLGIVPAGATMGNATVLIQSVDSAGPTTFPFTTAVSVNADAVGTTYTFTVAVPSVLTPLAGAQNLADQASGSLNWYAPVGTVDQLGGGAVTGVIDWYMTFIPLAPGVVITDAS